MPYGNGMGPQGAGPMTGRGMGQCCRMGFGGGLRSAKNRQKQLVQYKAMLEDELETVNEELAAGK